MSWTIEYLPEAVKDLSVLDGSVKAPVLKAIRKVSENPLPDSEGGYGKPLGNHSSSELAGFMKIKLKKAGLRIVYKLERTDTIMKIVIISARVDEQVYIDAEKRIRKYDL